ncbi:MAG: ribose-phosphate pyrophosphokinase-like domain-containing protein, partial [Clostridia bacterium]|nr:ribose-phosphate pyrophosphokinase-like domain-containing protein [Clostridia bacterium]
MNRHQGDGHITIFAGSASKPFAEKMCRYLEVELGKSTTHIFSEGGIYVRADESIRNKDVYIVQ